MPDLVSPRGLDFGSLHQSIAECKVPGVASVDLSAMEWISPMGMVALTATVDHSVRSGEEVRFTPPNKPGSARYLDRMGLTVLLSSMGVDTGLARVQRFDVGDSLLELRAFDSTSGAEELARHIEGLVAPQDKDAASVLFACLAEAGANIEDHSGLHRGFLAAQTTHAGSKLRFAVGDSGQGFLQGLLHRGVTDDADALDLALTSTTSRLDDLGRGLGLFTLSNRLRSLGGGLIGISGHAFHFHAADERPTIRSHSSRYHGSLIEGFVSIGV